MIMSDLIEALKIFIKYYDCEHPFSCEHDTLYVTCIDPELVLQEDIQKLDELGFFIDEENGGFVSYRFGSS